jgi:hypothetical protein
VPGFPEPHPAKGVLATRRISNRRVARALACSPTWVGRVLNGHVPAPERFRSGLAELLDYPEALLFHDPEAVAT